MLAREELHFDSSWKKIKGLPGKNRERKRETDGFEAATEGRNPKK